jgi:hypothetical protein
MHRDAILLEMTFISIWLSLSLPQAPQLREEQEQPQPQQQPQQQRPPAVLLLRWLLFKVLLVSGSMKATVVCPAAPSWAECFRAMAAQGHPHGMTW